MLVAEEMPRLSSEKKNEIVKLWQEKLSFSEIMKITGVAKSTICYTLKKFRQTGTTLNVKPTGRLPKLSYKEEKRLISLSKCHPKASSRELLELLNPIKKVTTGLVRQKLLKANMRARIASKKRLMTKLNRRKRLEWCRKNRHFCKKYWENWGFTDESTFELHPRRRYVLFDPMPSRINAVFKNEGYPTKYW